MGILVGTMFAILFAALAGAGTLGFLIPPSNIMIIYGVLGDVSILKLFTAGFLPGLMLAIFRNIPLDKLLAQYAWNILTTQELLALPMFILMGEILFQSRLSRSLFQGLAPWAGLLPGRLLHVNVVGCSIESAPGMKPAVNSFRIETSPSTP